MKHLEPIYADFASSAPPLPEVVDAMMEWLGGSHANPHADHLPGHRAARAIDDARQHIGDLLDADPDGVIFTSGATESNNLALKGLAGNCIGGLYFSSLDHSSIVEVAHHLAETGQCRVGRLQHDAQGSISPAAVKSALTTGRGRALVALAHGNNEIGTIQVLSEIGAAISGEGHLFHVDASQTAAHVPISVQDMRISTLSISGHKLYGPAGIGALWLDPTLKTELSPLLHGGGQQGGVRSGTVPTYLAVGLGVAARLARDRMGQARAHLQAMASQFIGALASHGISPVVIGHPSDRLPGHLSVRFPGAGAPDLLARLLPLLAVSSGAACSAGELRASRVLRALGLDEETASEGLRISFGRSTTAKEVAQAAEYMSDAVREVLDSI
ncbi:aminotransferase class V-fold PLP-dependent enzyme [Stenotrophomonas aracearum]|uniref:Aminotransferase class V-fold PLP-dependent enzyme n=1 Tax=Stenotrophomonas aracearum TaxID=3003272 RepID=A0ABY9YDU8_9GAMM|nr:aminotransferase class V-fold PLP-dependent enzyme [Stenotrophomonas sp. A5588]WNH48509.1 aminotransferase class V-fold PLP-dependent enzyme [Stenotrophomonas sp. A5588]